MIFNFLIWIAENPLRAGKLAPTDVRMSLLIYIIGPYWSVDVHVYGVGDGVGVGVLVGVAVGVLVGVAVGVLVGVGVGFLVGVGSRVGATVGVPMVKFCT